jgi:hypothetical protein
VYKEKLANSTLEITEAENGRMLAEGNATDFNSKMLMYEFGCIRLQDENELLKCSVDTLTSENQTR